MAIIGRRCATTSDEKFMRELHKAAYYDVVVQQFGKWDDAFQAALFSKKESLEKFEILELNHQLIGCIRIENHPDHIFFAEIQILPEFQGRGIGSNIIRTEIARAYEIQKPIRLQVLRENKRAKHLYERLGFVEYGKTEKHFLFQIGVKKE